jgi:uncharacterized protein YbjT (DUF2867 family)
MMATDQKILLIGATGMIGGAIVNIAAQPITALVRRSLNGVSAMVNVNIVDPADWPDRISAIAPDIIINCLGTTIRTVGGDRDAFRKVDYDLVLNTARAAKSAGARHMITVSSVGAAPNSGSFYLRTKGEVERDLTALAFHRLDILRPGLLMGDRAGPARPGEALAMRFAPLTDALMLGPLRKYRSINADRVARAILALTKADKLGVHVHEHDAIMALAN